MEGDCQKRAVRKRGVRGKADASCSGVPEPPLGRIASVVIMSDSMVDGKLA